MLLCTSMHSCHQCQEKIRDKESKQGSMSRTMLSRTSSWTSLHTGCQRLCLNDAPSGFLPVRSMLSHLHWYQCHYSNTKMYLGLGDLSSEFFQGNSLQPLLVSDTTQEGSVSNFSINTCDFSEYSFILICFPILIDLYLLDIFSDPIWIILQVRKWLRDSRSEMQILPALFAQELGLKQILIIESFCQIICKHLSHASFWCS